MVGKTAARDARSTADVRGSSGRAGVVDTASNHPGIDPAMRSVYRPDGSILSNQAGSVVECIDEYTWDLGDGYTYGPDTVKP